MANTLTSLIPSLYESLDQVLREQVGFIPSVALDAGAAQAAVGQSIYVPITPASAAVDIVPSMNLPAQADQVIGNTAIVITRSKEVPFTWSGEEQRGLNANGPGYNNIKRDQIVQAMRTLCNFVESDIAIAASQSASRAYGTIGTLPFATNLAATAQVRKILADNGAPLSDLSLVIDSASGASMRTLTQLSKANEAGDTSLLRQGVLLNVHGFDIRESAQTQLVTAGTGTLYKTVGPQVAGDTSIALNTGSGTINAGDVITFAGDTNQYVVTAGIAAPGTITIGNPGLRGAVAGASNVTVVASHNACVGFHRNAIALVTRAPAAPEEGDLAMDRMVITDPRSGLSFEVSMWPGNRMVAYKIALAWGVKVIKPAAVAQLVY